MPRHALPQHVIGFDDAPFAPEYRGDVLLVGAVYCGARLEGVLSTKVRRDGANAGQRIIGVVKQSRFAKHLQLILMQGIAVAGFNVVDVHAVHEALGIPVLVVSRKRPNFAAIERALRNNVRGGVRKWQLIERLGPMEAAGEVYVQRVGIDLQRARRTVEQLASNGALPEPLRTAHLIASGVTLGESRHRA